MTLTTEIAEVAASHARLHLDVTRLPAADFARQSRLEGWSVAQTIGHLAENARDILRRLKGAAAGELIERYPGGPDARARGIDAAAALPPAELTGRLADADTALDAFFAAAPEELWGRPVLAGTGGGQTIPASELVFSRWREAEIHHVDLGVGYTPADWPDTFVAYLLPKLLGELPQRVESRGLAAWLTGRGDAPVLPPWS